jgi:cell division protein FtsW
MQKKLFLSMSPNTLIGFSVLALNVIGLIILASASQSFSPNTIPYFQKQLSWLGLACGFLLLAYKLPWGKLRNYAWVLGGLTVGLLVLVLIPGLGVKVNGAQRWLNLKIIRLQVSEFAKVGLIVVLAHYLAAQQRHIHTFKKGFLWPACITGLFSFLIIIEPDFGTAFLCGLVGFTLMFLAGTRLLFLLPCMASGLLAFGIAVLLNPVRLKRITAFLDLEGNKSEGAYQLWQGIIGFGSGGLHGLGLGNGRQQLAFLPEAHTDFIFPIIGEELGLIFTLGIAGLFFLIFLIGALHIPKAPHMYSFILASGSLLFIVFQALINMGVVTGLLPTKGMCLPFISYGGTNIMVMLIFVGILMHCLREWSQSPLTKATEL